MPDTAVAAAQAMAKESKLRVAGRIGLAVLLWVLLIMAISCAGALLHIFTFLMDGLGVELSFPTKMAITMQHFWSFFAFYLFSPFILILFVLSAFRNSFAIYLRATLVAVTVWAFLLPAISVIADVSTGVARAAQRDSFTLDDHTLRVIGFLNFWQAHFVLCGLLVLVAFLSLSWLRASQIRRLVFASKQ